MSFAPFDSSHIALANERISAEDSSRQQRAAVEILERLGNQPGVILADEVGMGKTFVALAVAASIMLERQDADPVVIMCPPSLREKWPRDWEVFRSKCMVESARNTLRATAADSGVAFLRLLDDPPDRRSHLIFLTHGAFHRSIGDHWAKLAVIQRAFRGRASLAHQKESFQRFAGTLLRVDWLERRAPGLLGELIQRPHDQWLRTITRADSVLAAELGDDPVPSHLAHALRDMPSARLDGLVDALRALPRRSSLNIEERLREARREIAAAMSSVWHEALLRTTFRSPLLVLDEAHHVKNPETRLASLFASPEAEGDMQELGGALGGKFERMLFLTATPFQLGHNELIRVVERFKGVAWQGPNKPTLGVSEFKEELDQLATRLDEAQAAALRLERSWGRLDASHLTSGDGTLQDPDEWWISARDAIGEGLVSEIAAQVARTKNAIDLAEARLSKWVLRYIKAKHLPGAATTDRRTLLTGASIKEGGASSTGLEIGHEVLLPFLLAGRAQAMFATCARGRALFADGLSSSFEAYVETRDGRVKRDDDPDELAPEEVPVANSAQDVEWYLKHLDRALPRTDEEMGAIHPKVQATAQRALALWARGEKVLIFCHYRATGRALRQHVSRLLHSEIIRLAQRKLPNANDAATEQRLSEISEAFFENDKLKAAVTGWIANVVLQFPKLSSEEVEQITEVVRRFVRTPSFVARYMPMSESEIQSSFATEGDAEGEGQRSLRLHVEHFCRFLQDRCVESERMSYLAALDSIQTGSHLAKDSLKVLDAAEIGRFAKTDTRMLLPNVRLANGEVRAETRARLLLAFNTPLFPEILIASSVMAEGVDLHLNCRHVIHHDLCWNPSTLEQRTGRVDRIGSKAERVSESILIYMPYLAATQDEKMFRVVRDRERWFQVIMGEKYEVDEAATDKQAARVPLPAAVQKELSMRLHP